MAFGIARSTLKKDTLNCIKIAEIFYENEIFDKAKIMLFQALGVAYYTRYGDAFIKNVIAVLKSTALKFSSDRKFIREVLRRVLSLGYEYLEKKELVQALKELECFEYWAQNESDEKEYSDSGSLDYLLKKLDK